MSDRSLISSARADTAPPTELLMLTLADCGACQQFERDIGHYYARTTEARRAPLRRLSYDGPVPPDLTLAGPVHGAPTFILIHDRREVGRISGYSNDELFWMRLAALLGQLPAGRETAQTGHSRDPDPDRRDSCPPRIDVS